KERAAKAKQEAKERAKGETEEADTTKGAEPARDELYSGKVTLLIAQQAKYDRLREFERSLAQVKGLRIILVGGSADEGNKIVVSAEQPIPLLNILNELPFVESLSKKDKWNDKVIEIMPKAAR
ncbi:MAG: hypothetical protein HW414_521, partial [Dehalococcoidia bacterium]|nr:hypothetical protein [Dehalococcoidia bacterium]